MKKFTLFFVLLLIHTQSQVTISKDTSFGNSGYYKSAISDQISDFSFSNDDKILVYYTNTINPKIVKLNLNGIIDANFANTGILNLNSITSSELCKVLSIPSSTSFYVIYGSKYNYSFDGYEGIDAGTVSIYKYLNSGAIDTSFANNGILQVTTNNRSKINITHNGDILFTYENGDTKKYDVTGNYNASYNTNWGNNNSFLSLPLIASLPNSSAEFIANNLKDNYSNTYLYYSKYVNDISSNSVLIGNSDTTIFEFSVNPDDTSQGISKHIDKYYDHYMNMGYFNFFDSIGNRTYSLFLGSYQSGTPSTSGEHYYYLNPIKVKSDYFFIYKIRVFDEFGTYFTQYLRSISSQNPNATQTINGLNDFNDSQILNDIKKIKTDKNNTALYVLNADNTIIKYLVNDTTTLSTSDSKNLDNIQIYPTHTKNTIYLKSKNLITVIKIWDQQGKLVYNKSYSPQLEINVDVSSLTKGVYTMNIGANGLKVAKKFIKE